jgi:4-amino-4-deoxy-L-arabinose transferase-like glycosyltransferase
LLQSVFFSIAQKYCLRVRTSTQALLIFIGATILLRFFSFFPSVIDHDESTYIVIADALLQGYTYQVDYIDTKPIGIFLIIALIQSVFGNTVVIIRLAGALMLGFTSFFLYKAMRQEKSSHWAGLAAGILYLLMNSIFTRTGISPNTETYFNLFTAIALWLYLQKGALWKYFLAGLSLGVGFVIKYVVLFDGIAFGLFLLWQAAKGKTTWVQAWQRALLMAAAAAIPFAALLLYYQQLGQLDELWFHTFTVGSRYPSKEGILHYISFPLEFVGRFSPIVFLAVLVYVKKAMDDDKRQLASLWMISVLVVILLMGNHFSHYFIQMMLPLSYVAGSFFDIPPSSLPSWLKWIRRPKIGYPLLALLIVVNIFFQKKDYWDAPDYPKQIATYLEERLQPGEYIYTAEDQIIYHLIGQLPLIKYVHPSLFWREKHINAMEIPLEVEIRKITDAEPRFLIFRQPIKDDRFENYRKQYYEEVYEIEGHSIIYERKPSKTGNTSSPH